MDKTLSTLATISTHHDPSLPFLTCPICKQAYENPKILSCWHSFCLKCLESYAPENSITLTCPSCCISSVLPEHGLNYLPDNFLLTLLKKSNGATSNDLFAIESCCNVTIPFNVLPNDNSIKNVNSLSKLNAKNDFLTSTTTLTNLENCFDSSKYLNKIFENGVPYYSTENDHNGASNADTASSSAVVLDDSIATDTSQSGVFSRMSSSDYSSEKIFCRIHNKKVVEFFCNQCNTVLCFNCAGLEHYGHSQTSLEEAIEKYKKLLQSVNLKTKQNCQLLLKNKYFIEKTKQNLSHNYTKAKQACLESFKELQEILKNRMDDCFKKLNSVYAEREKVLNDQLEQINNYIIAAKNQEDFSEKVLDSEKSELILLATKAFNCEIGKENEISGDFQFKINSPAESSFIEFDSSNLKKLEASFKQADGIIFDESICKNLIGLSKLDLEKTCLVNSPTKIHVSFTGNKNEEMFKDTIKQKLDDIIHAEIIAPNHEKLKIAVEPLDSSTTANKTAICYLKFNLQQPGFHILEVFIYGIPIQGSPFGLTAHSLNDRRSSQNLYFNVTKQPLRNRLSVDQNIFNKTSILSQNSSNKVCQNTIKNKNLSSPVHKSNSSLNRPPWNRSLQAKTPIRRTESIDVIKNTPASKNKNSSNAKINFKLFTEQKMKTDRMFKETIDEENYHEDNGEENDNFLANVDNRLRLHQTRNAQIASNLKYSTHVTTKFRQNIFASTQNNASSLTFKRDVAPKTIVERKLSVNIQKPNHPHQQLIRSKTTTFVNVSKRLLSSMPLSKTNDKIPHVNPPSENKVKSFGFKGSGMGEFLNVQDVCAEEGIFWVTDSKNRCLQSINAKTGIFTDKINLANLSLKVLSSPNGICIDCEGKIFATDYENHCVLVFNKTGRFVKKFGSNQLLGPKGIAIDNSQGNLLVVDNRGCCVQTFSPSGEFLFRFGIQGYREEELCRPHFVAISEEQNLIIISDFRADRVKMFTKDGKFVKCFGSNILRGPTGLAIDKNTGNIVVCDFGNSKIQVYDSNGLYICPIDTSSSPLIGPQGINFLDDEHVVVADSGNHCLKVFEYKI